MLTEDGNILLARIGSGPPKGAPFLWFLAARFTQQRVA
jgi:hypothetical protein